MPFVTCIGRQNLRASAAWKDWIEKSPPSYRLEVEKAEKAEGGR